MLETAVHFGIPGLCYSSMERLYQTKVLKACGVNRKKEAGYE
ncbi:MAG: hypothetical protein ACLRMJ_08035 [Alistipes finegoldii]